MLSRLHASDGFTLLEVLVAITLLGAGILGLSASAALVSRMVGDGWRRTLAATVATARFEHLRALPCASATSGSATTLGTEERWTVALMGAPGGHALEVQLSVTHQVRARHGNGATRTQLFRGAVHCTGA